MSFDPYHQWLGIPPTEQPPNHYRLLGLGAFETNLDVISSAADRQMAHVKTFQLGQHVAESQRLLSEIVAVRGCLLNDESKTAYDLQLRLSLAAATSFEAVPTVAEPVSNVSSVSSSPKPTAVGTRQTIIGIVGAITLVVLVIAVASIMTNADQRDVTEQVEQPTAAVDPLGTADGNVENPSPAPPEPPSVVNTSVITENDDPATPAEPKENSKPEAAPAPEATTPPTPESTETELAPTENPVEAVADVDPTPVETQESEAQPPTELNLPGRLTVPTKEEQAAAKALVRDVFQSEYENAATAEDKAAVAKKLFVAAKDPGNDAPSRYAMLDVARIMAVHAGDADGLLAIIDEMNAHYEVDALTLKQEAFVAWSKKSMPKETRAELAKRMFPIAQQAAAAERYEVAVAMLQLARDTARRGGDIQFVKDVATRLKVVEEIANQYSQVTQSLAVLAVDPSDEGANDLVGRYYSLVRGDLKRGLPFLTRGKPGALRAAAIRDLSGANQGAEQLALGDLWWELAQSEQSSATGQLLVRAHHWYSAAAPNLSGLAKTKCEKRLKETSLAMVNVKTVQKTSSSPLAAGLEFDGTSWVETDLKYDGKTPLTIEVWITPVAGTKLQTIVGNCHGNGLALQITADQHWGFYVRDKKSYQGAVSNEKVVPGQRVHVAGVFDGQFIRIYVNGKLQDKFGKMGSGHKVANYRMMIGADPDGADGRPQLHFQGTIESVHVAFGELYQKNFSPKNPPSRTSASVLLLKLDEGQGEIAKDTSERRHDAKIHDAKWKHPTKLPGR